MILFVIAIVTTPACHKDKPCKAIITVLDAANNPVGGATVELDPSGTCPTCTQIQAIQTATDASGKASFETSLPKIMDITIITSTTYPTGKVVRFEQGKTDEVTINLP
ncbi:MAG TPA: hypothetical protein VL651_12635 [Bacteroidia bacterium]|nr:hypothetical protein [Bacteroidia bacterium]